MNVRRKLSGATRSGTTTLRANAKGLYFRTELPAGVSYADDLVKLIARGDISQCSFGFSVSPGDDDWTGTAVDEETGEEVPLRRINRVSKLYDVSVVSSPAYPGTSVGLSDRSLPTMPPEIRAKLARLGSPTGFRCRCPIWTQGTLNNEIIREALNTRVWSEANETIQKWNAAGTREPKEPPAPMKKPAKGVTIVAAVEAFKAEMAGQQLRDSSQKKYRVMFRELEVFCKTAGITLVCRN